ncbi:MAG: efflux RND transporter periplasmic adaptor subunit [Verrucomicrobiota bacterium]
MGTYRFPVEKEAVGSVSFEEDPAIVQAKSTLVAAAATYVVNSNELLRAQALYGTNGVSRRELEQATSDEQSAGAALKAVRDALRALGKTDAEIDAMITAGEISSAPASSSPVKWVLANVLESDSPLIHTGQTVHIKVMAFPNLDLEGKVSKIYATVDPNIHRLAIRCTVNDSRDELRPGMLANVAIEVAKPIETIAVPANGVVREGDGTMTVWVTTDRRHFTQRLVKTGLREDGEVQILDGLQGGELVVTDGAIFLDNMLQAPVDD